MQSLMKLANKKGNEVGPEVVDEIESESINVVSNTQLKVQPSRCAAADKPLNMSLQGSDLVITGSATTSRFRKTLNVRIVLGQCCQAHHHACVRPATIMCLYRASRCDVKKAVLLRLQGMPCMHSAR